MTTTTTTSITVTKTKVTKNGDGNNNNDDDDDYNNNDDDDDVFKPELNKSCLVTLDGKLKLHLRLVSPLLFRKAGRCSFRKLRLA